MFITRLVSILLAAEEKIFSREGFQKIFTNIGWLFFDRIFQMGVGLFVGVWVARYLGPDDFGLFNYAFAFASLFGFASTLGLKNVVVRDIVEKPGAAGEILGTSFVLHLAGGFLAFAMALVAIFIARPDDALSIAMVALLASTYVFKSADVVRYWMESRVESKYIVWIQNSFYLLLALSKVIMIIAGAPVIAFIAAFFVYSVLVSMSLMLFYARNEGSFSAWRARRRMGAELLRSSWPFILSGLMISIHMRIDQIMIHEMLDANALGQYAAAVKISEAWHFIPAVVLSSCLPSIINAKTSSEELYYSRLRKLYALVVWVAVSIALPFTFLGAGVVNLLYGAEYGLAGGVLRIQIWAAVSAYAGSVWSKWIFLEGRQFYITLWHTIAALLNVSLNLHLIGRYGINGAAMATLLSSVVSSFVVFSLYEPKKAYGMFFNSFLAWRFFPGAGKVRRSGPRK